MKVRVVTSRLLVCAVAFGLQLAAPAATAQTFSRSIAGSEIAVAMQKALGGTTVHLHNLGPLSGDTYHVQKASSIKVPASISGMVGQRSYFTLPDSSTTFLNRRYGYYVDHVRSNGVFVTAGVDTFTISITLASLGPSLVGTCVHLKAPVRPCASFVGESVLPPIEWRDARIDIVAKPVVVRRSLALEVQTVAINGEFDIGKACGWPLIGGKLCAVVNRLSQRMRQRVAEQVKADLNTAEVQQAVAAGVRQYLDANLDAQLLGVRRVSMQDGNVVVALAFGR